MEQKEVAADKAESATQTTQGAAGEQNPSWWPRFKNYVRESSSFTDWCVAFFTLVLISVSISQCRVTSSQLNVARKDLRAWLQITIKDTFPLSTNAVPSATIAVNNTGKTPATQVSGDLYIEIVPNGRNPKFESPGPHTTMFSGAIFPNAPQDTLVTRVRPPSSGTSDEGVSDPLSDKELLDLNEGRSWIAIHGRIEYWDTFRTKHWLTFCSWFSPRPGSYSARECTAYNNIDDNG